MSSAARRRRGDDRRRHRPVLRGRRRATRCAPRCDFPDGDEAAAEVVRVEPGARATGRPRRQRHPPGGRPQRARGVVHQGLLRRPGDGRAVVLPRQAEPAPARAAAERARGARDRAAPGRESRRQARLGGRLARPRPIGLALVRREANPGDTVARRRASRHSSWTSPSRDRFANSTRAPTRKGAAHGRSRDRARQPHRRGA